MCDMVVTPTATNAAWQREIWPLVQTSRASEPKTIMLWSPPIHTGSRVPTTVGTTARAMSPAPVRMAAVRRGIGLTSGIRLRRLARRFGNRLAGTARRTTRRTRNGTAGGIPLKGGLEKYLVARLAARPTVMPPRYVSGRLENIPMAQAPKA